MDWTNIRRSGRFESTVYETELGAAVQGDANDLLCQLEDRCADLVITSPPFALQRKKEYGNKDQSEYVNWLLSFAPQVRRVLKESGSFVLDLGGAYQKGKPVRSLYNFEVLLRLCKEQDFRLAEEFFWFNPAKLPSPIEWVNKRKIRAKDAVNTVWWLSKSDDPKADVNKVKIPYSDRMKKLLKDQSKFYTPKERPSGHDISTGFGSNNGGAIPTNLLQVPNTESNSLYLRRCKSAGVKPHPARFPVKLPTFFVKMLTDRNDVVIDIFAGSNTTGAVCESHGRRWLAFDLDRGYLATSMFRFLPDYSDDRVAAIRSRLLDASRSSYWVQETKPSFDL